MDAPEDKVTATHGETIATDQSAKSGGYGKRPVWQWVLIYLIVGGIIYYLVYYFFLRGGSGY